jgi:hypothetical protein
MRRNFADSLEESKFDKIFKTIPSHVFWDIKRPMLQHMSTPVRLNHINPTRQHYVTDFFSARQNEEWRHQRKQKRDFYNSLSQFQRY